MKVSHVPTGAEMRASSETKGKSKQLAEETDGLVGVSGHVFATGNLVNVPEAYKEPLFDPKVAQP